MTKQNFLAMSLGSGLKVVLNQKGKFNLDEEYPQPHDEICEITQIINCGDNFEYEISDRNVSYGFIEEDEFDIIARPLSDITKEIEHNGEKFVPMKNFNCGLQYVTIKNGMLSIWDGDMWTYSIYAVPFGYIKKLIEWHFAIGLDESDYIDINTIENPYK